MLQWIFCFSTYLFVGREFCTHLDVIWNSYTQSLVSFFLVDMVLLCYG